MNKAVLFDLDGTLLDTGPDFEYIVNDMRQQRGIKEPVNYPEFRPHIARGSAAMTQYAFQLTPEDVGYDEILKEFYSIYMQQMGRYAKLFPGIDELIQQLDEANIKWGVVSNRQLAFMPKILQQFNLHDGAHCIVGSDSTPHRKPHPAPLLHAAELLSISPRQCFYVGDFASDIEAAKAAGMHSIAATWGYHDGLESLLVLKPDYVVDQPKQIASLVNN